jgi:hypothetical protein
MHQTHAFVHAAVLATTIVDVISLADTHNIYLLLPQQRAEPTLTLLMIDDVTPACMLVI